MTTKTVDSVISEILQTNPSVDPQQDPIATIQSDERCRTKMSPNNSLFDLNAVHNGEACIASLDPKDEKENKFWFTIAMFVTIFNESDQTIRNNIESLYQDGELGLSKIFERRINIEDSCGVPHPTTIYNLEVLNKLGMCCFRKNKKAKEIRNKFNDVLIKHETHSVPDSYMIEDPIERAKRWIEEQAEKKRIEAERNAALEAETRAIEASKQSFQARATAMGRLSSIADREYLAHMTETVCKKQLGILRPSRYKAEHLMGTPWMRSCFRADAYKPMRRWLTSMASRRVTARLASELGISTGDASDLRELYVEAKLYGVDFDTLAEERGFMDVRKAQKVLASCVAVVDRYECNKGDGEEKTCPVCGYSPEIWGEALHALADSSQVWKWLRDDTSVDELEWWIDEKANENYGLQTI